MSNSATQEPLLLERAYIEGWVLALTFGAEEELRAGHVGLGVVLVAMTLVVQAIVIKWAVIKARLTPTFPRFFITFNSLASDARWWVATLMIFLVGVTLSRFIEQQRLPQSSLLEIVAALVFATGVFCVTLSIGRRYQHRKLMLSLGTILIVASLAALAAGAALVMSGMSTGQQTAAPSVLHSVIHEPASAEVIANATEPIRAELDNAKQQAASLQSQLTAAIKERDAARQIASPATLNNQNVEYRRLNTDQMRILIKEFADLKGDIPKIFLTRANDVRGEANQYMRDFMEAFERAGIEVQSSIQSPAGPDQTGVMIAVQDVDHQPLIAKKLSIVLQKAGVQTTTIKIPHTLIGVEFALFVGPNPL